MKFTAHNIDLGNGKHTMEENPMLLSETQECQAILRSLNRTFDPAVRSSIKVADLGCLEGGYTVEIARCGYQITGFEARTSSIEKCNFVKEQLGLPNLSFIQEDVKNLEKYGQFDVILCHGLLYHLDQPASFIKMLGSLSRKMLILDTHYAQPRDFLYDFLPFLNPYKRMITKRLPFLSRKHNYALSGLTQYDGKQGRWFKEYQRNASRDQIEKSVWAAFSNNRAFWLCKKDLLQSIKEAGFSSVYEQYDRLEDMYDDTIEKHDRGSFVCYK